MPDLGRFWTVSNVLSLSRLPAAAGCMGVILAEGPVVWSLGLILLAAMTDWLDGAIARWSGTVTEWGKVLDPVCDKIAAAGVGLILAFKGLLPVWFIVLVVARDMLLIAGSVWLHRQVGSVHVSNTLGKVTVFAVAITFVMGLLRADAVVMDFFLWTGSGLIVLSLGTYILRFIAIARADGTV
ncbi:MAG: CDP-alcohol phosphatidyltransferase family protein [Bacteroidota bacterium]|nr:CDP-alcohol phosphatidyltransferase family protein [Bacteroidota bacterium]MDE2834997.1 CDP-alcohol phosphatidyltransferase family protein [Bacteroidota bacterium]MDE2956025.1 CDP-alcohol phosphatidyltransferase family protein [Bacteroidota bacterium]